MPTGPIQKAGKPNLTGMPPLKVFQYPLKQGHQLPILLFVNIQPVVQIEAHINLQLLSILVLHSQKGTLANSVEADATEQDLLCLHYIQGFP